MTRQQLAERGNGDNAPTLGDCTPSYLSHTQDICLLLHDNQLIGQIVCDTDAGGINMHTLIHTSEHKMLVNPALWLDIGP